MAHDELARVHARAVDGKEGEEGAGPLCWKSGEQLVTAPELESAKEADAEEVHAWRTESDPDVRSWFTGETEGTG